MDVAPKQSPARWRIGPRFSLRALVLLVLLSAIGSGIYSWGLRRAQRQAPAAATLREFGARLIYDCDVTREEIVRRRRRLVDVHESPYPEWLISRLGIDFFHNVTEVHCESSRRLSDSDVKRFWAAVGKLPELTHLEASGGVTRAGSLRALDRHTQLESLALRWAEVAPTDYVVLQKLNRLERLNLSDTPITDECLANIGGIKTLKCLDLHHATITNAGIEYLAQLPRLERLWLSGTKVGDEGIALLRGHPTLTDLDLGYTTITDDSLSHVATISRLSQLDVAATAVTDHGLSFLEAHPTLSYLNLESTEVRGSGLASLQRLPNLEEICLGGRDKLKTAIDLAGCRRLERLKLFGGVSLVEELEQSDIPPAIELVAYSLSDKELMDLASNTKLKAIYGSWYGGYGAVTPSAVAAFRKARPDCEMIDDFHWPRRGLRSRP
jgi:Leucine Rich repeat